MWNRTLGVPLLAATLLAWLTAQELRYAREYPRARQGGGLLRSRTFFPRITAHLRWECWTFAEGYAEPGSVTTSGA